ncbi:MAG: hypothetical protein LUC90_07070, partial [Lachnospiraceae bacterium]|nr:hypothetical protein [Lachnospiraceae bacterium]
MNKIYDVIQISSRMSQDALALRGAEESDQTQILSIAEHDTGFGTTIAYLPAGASNEGRAAYRGVTYRGGGAWPDLMGNAGSVFQSKSMLSTSQFATVAADFLNMSTAENNVMVRFMLDGKGSVRIADVSQFGNEAEVLVHRIIINWLYLHLILC